MRMKKLIAVLFVHLFSSIMFLMPYVWPISGSLKLFGGIEGRRHRDSESVVRICGQNFSSDVAKNGTFSSPNYPEPYPPDIHCIYQFVGKGKERIQIAFIDFDLHLAHDPSRECDSVDVVIIFIIVDGLKERVDNFCGNKLPVQLMSSGPSMLVEFRSHHSSPEVKGFRANFKFVTDFGISSGRLDPSLGCSFVFDSEDCVNGSFTSPNYPGFYPRNTECHYFFRGGIFERVHIVFSAFDVNGIPPCTADTASDYVEFSNFLTEDRKLVRHCGMKRPKVIESDGNSFRVTFKSNEKFDGIGFEAFYQFKTYHKDILTVKRMSMTESNNSGVSWSSDIERWSVLLLTIHFLV